MESYKRVMLVLLGLVAALIAAQGASAYHYDYWDVDYPHSGYSAGLPIYQTGYYYGTYSYGFSGWNYNRVYYRYHQPYYTSRYYHPGVIAYPRPFLYRVYAPAIAYPFPGYYW